jgi:tRNA (guanine37-N1)-methyltransferase
VILVCGRYEGVDERALQYVDEELSVGDFVLTGGELAALCVWDAVARLQPGVLGNAESTGSESFEGSVLEHPQYTRPVEFRGARVPEVLQGGDHARIARWRRWHALRLTEVRRPDLFEKVRLSPEDKKLLSKSEDEL